MANDRRLLADEVHQLEHLAPTYPAAIFVWVCQICGAAGWIIPMVSGSPDRPTPADWNFAKHKRTLYCKHQSHNVVGLQEFEGNQYD